MIEKIFNLPDNVLGFTAKGMVTARDYDAIIIPAVEAVFAKGMKARFLYNLGEEFVGFEVVAMWDDTKLGFKHHSGWERMAVVTNVEWIRAAIKLFRLAMPVHVARNLTAA